MTLVNLPSITHLLTIGVELLYFIKFSAIGALGVYLTQRKVGALHALFRPFVSETVCGLMGFIYGLSFSEWM
ncbi:hypothetical protein K6U44_15340 [Vibrio parahaemolyticus]|uniref:hypothetical protein n=1 Tax=Vibrio parahaemolyticus TaxID=670 RepID=UPI001EEAA893|nr:hypothetical protein [Vibrio parahaemolyticus]MCG6461792.1 hypothetical protein [Vibrio parahaemolyticus]